MGRDLDRLTSILGPASVSILAFNISLAQFVLLRTEMGNLADYPVLFRNFVGAYDNLSFHGARVLSAARHIHAGSSALEKFFLFTDIDDCRADRVKLCEIRALITPE